VVDIFGGSIRFLSWGPGMKLGGGRGVTMAVASMLLSSIAFDLVVMAKCVSARVAIQNHGFTKS
jgi:hypothetical protein